MPNAVLTDLAKAIEGLFYSSESDEPFELLDWVKESGPMDQGRILRLGRLPPSTHVEIHSVEEFFQELTKPEDWHGDPEKEAVRKYRKLVEVISRGLTVPKVFRAGKVKVDIFIVGKCVDGGWAGVKTRAVET